MLLAYFVYPLWGGTCYSFVLKKLSFINLNMFFTYLKHESFVGHMQDFCLCFHSIVYIKE